jgi:hypothetical protein
MKTFSQQFEEYKNSLVGKGSLADESFLFWFKNFIDQPRTSNIKDLLSGKIYSFEYLDVLQKPKKFINKRPVVFFTGFGTGEKRDIFFGIDLILMPPMIRLPFFNRINEVYWPAISKNLQMKEIEKEAEQLSLKTDFEILTSVLSGIPFKNSFKSWNIKKVRDIKEITYQDWTKIVYLFTRSIEGTRIEEIYKKNMT